jgi:ABC-type uncharacterized transport system substrate-binding protein
MVRMKSSEATPPPMGNPRPRSPGFARLLASACIGLWPWVGHAHPHAWIDVHSTVLVSPDGRISAFREQWLFDDMYTAAVMNGMAADSPTGRATVGEFASEVMENLRPYGYFTKVIVDGASVPLVRATQFEGAMKKGRLQLSFTAPLATPVDPTDRHVAYEIYDPSYFIQMMHLPEQPPSIQGSTRRACHLKVTPPNPSPQDIARAYALDRGAQADDTLGDLFAEKVDIQCE